jgi:itaconyl-CoA hydratase
MSEDFRARAKLWAKGNRYEDFTPGRVFAHHWGRTINHGDNSLFVTLTLHYNPLYTNAEYARAHGHPDVQVCPLLVFNTVFGLSVEDLSEGGGPFLGVENLNYLAPVYPGDTLTARSTVLDSRVSEKFKGFGITTWQTEGFNQHGVKVLEYQRTNLVRRREE